MNVYYCNTIQLFIILLLNYQAMFSIYQQYILLSMVHYFMKFECCLCLYNYVVDTNTGFMKTEEGALLLAVVKLINSKNIFPLNECSFKPVELSYLI